MPPEAGPACAHRTRLAFGYSLPTTYCPPNMVRISLAFFLIVAHRAYMFFRCCAESSAGFGFRSISCLSVLVATLHITVGLVPFVVTRIRFLGRIIIVIQALPLGPAPSRASSRAARRTGA